jgi:tRNA pseudouridine38-40 synthase
MPMIIRLAYNGANYYGFQYQPDRPTVEGILRKYFGSFRYLSRLDAKVSALWQLVRLQQSNYNLNQINAYLPEDIIIISYTLQNISFKTDVKGKVYLYLTPKTWIHDSEMFIEALKLFEGTHDFNRFRKYDSRKDVSTICTIYDVSIKESEFFYEVYISGNRFLWQMVRRMVGAAVLASQGKLSLEDIQKALKENVPIKTLVAPGEFLILYKVLFNKPVQFYEINYQWKLEKMLKKFYESLAFTRWFQELWNQDSM